MARIRWRVLGSFLAIMVLVILVEALVSGYVLRGAFLDNLETDLASEARGFAVALSTAVPTTGTPPIAGAAAGTTPTDPAALEEFARRVGAAIATRITVIAHDGTVLADSEEDPALMENHRGRPEVATALAGSEGRARRVSTTLKQEMLYVAVPIGQGDLPWSGVSSAWRCRLRAWIPCSATFCGCRSWWVYCSWGRSFCSPIWCPDRSPDPSSACARWRSGWPTATCPTAWACAVRTSWASWDRPSTTWLGRWRAGSPVWRPKRSSPPRSSRR